MCLVTLASLPACERELWTCAHSSTCSPPVEDPPVDCVYPSRKIIERISCTSSNGETELSLLTYEILYAEAPQKPHEATDRGTDLTIEKWHENPVDWVVVVDRVARESETRTYEGSDSFFDQEQWQRHSWEFELPSDFSQPAKATRTWNGVVSSEELFCSWELP